jgi:hypothetical protein
MNRSKVLAAAVTALLGTLCAFGAHAERSTVCTVTVNSPDEREIFRKMLPAERFQFVELVVAGRKNREVAAELSLSPNTVAWNLSKIYRKLGVGSRTELAALGQRHALRLGRPRLLLAWSERWRASALTVPAVRPVDDGLLQADLVALREVAGDFAIAGAAGLSLGEMTAHVAAGTFDFGTGLKLVQKRGELMDEACAATEGAMAAMIGAPENTVRQLAAAEPDDTWLAARFRAAGFVFVGKTNTPDLTLGFETTNLVYGRTNNPWDLTRTPGGSTYGRPNAAAEDAPRRRGQGLHGRGLPEAGAHDVPRAPRGKVAGDGRQGRARRDEGRRREGREARADHRSAGGAHREHGIQVRVPAAAALSRAT